MRKYELLSIIKPNMDAEEADKVIAKLEESIKALGGSVSSTDKMGRKKLAHDIQNFRDGHYVAQRIELAPDKVLELRLNQLDTEQSELQTELESVKKILEKNIENVFNTFS